jgi:hypothetical protein
VKIEFRIFEEIPVAHCNDYHILLEGEVGVHKQPHVHLRKKGTRLASIEIKTLEVFDGKVPKAFKDDLFAWIDRYRKCLLEDWEAMQIHKRPREYDFDPYATNDPCP